MPRTELRFTRHALDTMQRRGVKIEDVYRAVRSFEYRYHSPEHRGRPTPYSYVYVRGPLSVVVAEEGDRHSVVTVLLRSSAQWDDETMQRTLQQPRP